MRNAASRSERFIFMAFLSPLAQDQLEVPRPTAVRGSGLLPVGHTVQIAEKLPPGTFGVSARAVVHGLEAKATSLVTSEHGDTERTTDADHGLARGRCLGPAEGAGRHQAALPEGTGWGNRKGGRRHRRDRLPWLPPVESLEAG